MATWRRLFVACVAASATAGCGLTLDLDPAAPSMDAGTSVTPRDASIADARIDMRDDAHVDAPFNARVDAPATRPDAGAGCPRNTHWPADGSCGRVLFADSFDATSIRADWVLLRTEFALVGGHLEMRPEARALPGGGTFDYGHSANGRGGIAAVNVDGHLGAWTSYRVDWTARVTSTDEAFTMGLPPGFSPSGCDASASIYFRAQAITESWNEPPGATYYNFGISSGAAVGCAVLLGNWSLGAQNGYWIPGYGYAFAPYEGFADQLVGSSRDPGSPYPPYAGFTGTANRAHDYAIEVSGLTIDAWVDGTHLLTYTDGARTMTTPDGVTRSHTPLTYGGVAFTAAFDEPYWIDDVVVTELR